jgi:SAM-dependent methyltransferase
VPAADVSDLFAPVREATTVSLYGSALAGAAVAVRCGDGTLRPLASPRWLGAARDADLSMLDRVRGPVLDVGCGPGRLVVALQRRSVPALGIDVSPAAVHMARRAGARALQRCVFAPLPRTGRWSTVLLADGNIGIGGDPQRLLRRVRDLLPPDGQVVLEVAPPGGGTRRHAVRLESGSSHGAWFWWSRVPEDDVAPLCAAVGLRVTERWRQVETSGAVRRTRWFALACAAEQRM